MNDTKKAIQVFLGDLKEHVETRIDISSLVATEKSAEILSTLITKGALFILFFLVLIFCSLGLAIYVGDRLQNLTAGFLWVGGGYAVLAIICILLKETWLKTPILNSLIKQLFKDEK
ncbi:MAG: phage holin family protein [Fimbriimonadaceae bacterium]|nr:phage holin family protein [Chitinophagales bacterium]